VPFEVPGPRPEGEHQLDTTAPRAVESQGGQMFLPGAIALWAAFLSLVASTFFYFRSVRATRKRGPGPARRTVSRRRPSSSPPAVLVYLSLPHDFRIHYVFSYSASRSQRATSSQRFGPGRRAVSCCGSCGDAGRPAADPVRPALRRPHDGGVQPRADLTLLILLRQSPFRFISDLTAGQVPFDGRLTHCCRTPG